MSKNIVTVTGEIPAEKLGKCLMHEHALFGYPGWQCSLAGFPYESAMDHVSKMLKNLKEQYDLRTIVDATPNDCGRNVEFLKDLSERTGVQIIASTGCYYEGEGATPYFKIRGIVGDPEKEIYEMMKKEITEGVAATGIKAGVIKVGTSAEEITPYEDMFLKAAGKVSAETGCRIITHTQEGRQGSEQVRRLVNYGAKPEHIMIGHLDGCTDIDELFQIFEQGAYGAFDRMGLQQMAGTVWENRRIALLLGLAMSGYGKKIMLSQDYIAWPLGEPWIYPQEVEDVLKNWNWEHVLRDVIPALKEMGLKAEMADAMIEENPRHFLCED